MYYLLEYMVAPWWPSLHSFDAVALLHVPVASSMRVGSTVPILAHSCMVTLGNLIMDEGEAFQILRIVVFKGCTYYKPLNFR